MLRGAELSLARGESIALVGPSGAGKSTLLQIAGLLEHPDGGEVHLDAVPRSRAARRRAANTLSAVASSRRLHDRHRGEPDDSIAVAIESMQPRNIACGFQQSLGLSRQSSDWLKAHAVAV